MSPRTRTKRPTTPIAKRLEELRADRQLSLSQFHKAVVRSTVSRATYRSVNRWHTDVDAPIAYFGLGDFDQVDRVEIHWSTGERSEIQGDFAAGARYIVTRDGIGPLASTDAR